MGTHAVRWIASAAAAWLLASVGAAAQGPAPAPWPEALYNFKKADGDLVLPMPCGGGFALRRVDVPEDGALGDYRMTLGGTDEDTAYAENRHAAYIAGTFAGDGGSRHYYIGKYEVSRLQYDAVMSEACPGAAVPGRLPKVEVSWAEAVAFADRYTQWLLASAADRLPRQGEGIGYLRLPTEVEWEFAARGGIKVSPADFQERVFPMAEAMARYVWFAGSQSANGRLQLTGMLQPNPLGLHDMLGNADEMLLEPFRLNRLDRPHGQAGALVVRGGNYFTSEPDIRSAYRLERPMYDASGPVRAATTGFRLVLTAPVISSRERLAEIRDAWKALGAEPAAPTPEQQLQARLGDGPLADPVAEIDRLIEAVDTGVLKDRLGNLRTELKSTLARRNEQRDRAARTVLRLGAFLGRKLGDDGRAVDSLRDVLNRRVASVGADDARAKEYRERLEAEQAVMTENLRFYADMVIRAGDDYPAAVLGQQLQVLAVELGALGLKPLAALADRYLAHVKAYQTDGRVRREAWLADWKSR